MIELRRKRVAQLTRKTLRQYRDLRSRKLLKDHSWLDAGGLSRGRAALLDDSKSHGKRYRVRQEIARRLTGQDGGSRALRHEGRDIARERGSHVVRTLARHGMEPVHSLHAHAVVLTAGPAAGGN